MGCKLMLDYFHSLPSVRYIEVKTGVKGFRMSPFEELFSKILCQLMPYSELLLMEAIPNNHLGCTNPCK